MSKILGIDYGEKRIGLAISDESQTFARELGILSPKDFWKSISSVIEENQIGKIALGWPLNMKGEETEKTKETGKFKSKLAEITGLPVDLVDERLTSKMAESISGSKKNIDSLAAQIFLQNYLDRNKN